MLRRLLVAALCVLPLPALSDSTDRALVLALARVAAHEGALQNPRDLDLVWQVTEGYGATSDRRLRFLQQHSPRALGLEPPRQGAKNAFAAELKRNDTLPASVAAADRGTKAYWTHKVMPRWQDLLDRAEYLVAGKPYARPCPLKPVTWGGPMDHESAREQGRYPIGCEGTLNDGFAPRRTFQDAGRPVP
jgi:hypothetical protein